MNYEQSLEQAVVYIENHLGDPLTVEEVAREMCIRDSHYLILSSTLHGRGFPVCGRSYRPLLTFLTTRPSGLLSILNTICMKRATSSHASLLSGIRSMLI